MLLVLRTLGGVSLDAGLFCEGRTELYEAIHGFRVACKDLQEVLGLVIRHLLLSESGLILRSQLCLRISHWLVELHVALDWCRRTRVVRAGHVGVAAATMVVDCLVAGKERVSLTMTLLALECARGSGHGVGLVVVGGHGVGLVVIGGHGRAHSVDDCLVGIARLILGTNVLHFIVVFVAG